MDCPWVLSNCDKEELVGSKAIIWVLNEKLMCCFRLLSTYEGTACNKGWG